MIEEIMLYLIATGLGLLGSSTMVLLQYYSGKLTMDSKGKIIAFILLGGIAGFISALIGDGAKIVGPVGYFALGAIAPGFLGEIIEGYNKRKKE